MLNIGTYGIIDVNQFRIKAIQGIIAAVHERAQEEIDRAEEFAQEAQERLRQRDEAMHNQVLAHQAAIQEYDILNADVEEWVRNREQIALQEALEAERIVVQQERQTQDSERHTQGLAWEEMERARPQPPSRTRPPQHSRGRH